jgi:site-specific DNA recombinase
MSSSNGHGPQRAVLYARVSTEEQARSGYSLAQQMEALRVYAAQEGYEILEEVRDAGQSGASLERPGLDHVRDLVAADGVSVVLAQDRDRYTREPAHHYLLREEFKEHGCKLKALNDRGDDSPEGELMDGVFDQFAKFERAKTRERTRRGKLRKAQQGKIVAGHRPHYGFTYNANKNNYVIDPDEMRVVQRIFYMVGVEARSLRAVRKTLEAEGVPTPGGARYWTQVFVRSAILDDVYCPYAYEEVETLVTPEILARLDQDQRYGIFWHNTKRNTYKQVSETGLNGKTYRKKRKVTPKPREEWIAVPIPDSGIPREWVDAAREEIKNNRRSPSTSGRFWELSGGLLRCGHCDANMRNYTTLGSRDPDVWYFYYRCARQAEKGSEACPHKKMYPVADVEHRVWEFVSDLLTDPDQLRADLDAMIEEERQGMHGEPEQEEKPWLRKLAQVESKRSRFQDMAAEDYITFDELGAKLSDLEKIRTTAVEKLEAIRNCQERIEEMEKDRDAILESYALRAPEALDELAPEERHQVYRMLRLRAAVKIGGTLEVSGMFGKGSGICHPEVRSSTL